MVQTVLQSITFDEFIADYPEQSEQRYELREGFIFEMPKPKGQHSQIAGFLIAEYNFVIRQDQSPYFIPKECIIRSLDSRSGYEPDVAVLSRTAIVNEPRWAKESVITQGTSAPLLVEVVSTNWQDDYLTKLRDYEALGIQEYWIVDYLGLGGRRYLGFPKQPAITVHRWLEGEYEVQQFRGSDRIISFIFPTLDLTAAQIFAANR
jgi:Uma2 family endonuclease